MNKGKKIGIIIIAIVAVLVIIYIICALTGNLKSAEETSNSDSSISSGESAEVFEFGWNPQNAQSEQGTTARVDEILLQSGNVAKQISEDQAKSAWDEAFLYLKQHKEDFYESSEVMEHAMYYGEFIYRYIENNATASNIAELTDSTRAAYDAGYNTVKAIKYVYCGAEKIEDESTQSALSEAKEALDKFQ